MKSRWGFLVIGLVFSFQLWAADAAKTEDFTQGIKPNELSEDNSGLDSASLEVKGDAASIIENELKENLTVKTDGADAPVAKPETPKKESEIPLFASTKGKVVENKNVYQRFILSFVVVLLAAIGAILFARWWTKKHKVASSHTQIKVLTQHHLGPKKSLVIIRVAGESLLIGVTDQNVNLIKSLALLDEEVPTEVPENFNDTLKKTYSRDKKAEAKKITTSTSPAPTELDISSIKDLVKSKLKEMRPI